MKYGQYINDKDIEIIRKRLFKRFRERVGYLFYKKDGASDEDCDELRQRLITKIQTPATSGNCYDYMNWATTITGIENSKVYPLHHGNGTVMVMPVTSDGRAPTDEQITQVKEYIEEMRPVGADVYIEKPTEQFINITASITHTGVLTTIIQEYTELLNAYIQQSVFSNYTIDFNRCLSLFYTISNVGGLTSFQINGVEENIEINEMGIPVIGEIEITEG